MTRQNYERKQKMDLGNGLGHLTYSTLVHPADNWEQLWVSLNTYLPKVKARIAGNKSFGVCGRDVGEQPGRARQAEEISRRQRHVYLHCQRLRIRPLQGRCGEGTGL